LLLLLLLYIVDVHVMLPGNVFGAWITPPSRGFLFF
jgi:hypothetical protein